MPVTTRIIPLLTGEPEKILHFPLLLGGGYIDYKIKVCIYLHFAAEFPSHPVEVLPPLHRMSYVCVSCSSVPMLILLMWCSWCMDTRSVRRYMKRFIYFCIYIIFLFYLFISMYWCIGTQHVKCIIIHWSILNLHIYTDSRPFLKLPNLSAQGWYRQGEGHGEGIPFWMPFCFVVVVAVAYLY